MIRSLRRPMHALVLLSLVPFAVQAHPGHESVGFIGGWMHPLTGLDHLLAMLAVGIWAAQRGGRSVWALPCSFVAMMCAGAAWALTGGAAMLPIELGIAASVLILGVLIAGAMSVPTIIGVAVTGGFALFHGYAHGIEASAQPGSWTYFSGFALTTAALHAAGIGLAQTLMRQQQQRSLRWLGAAIAVCGLAFLSA